PIFGTDAAQVVDLSGAQSVDGHFQIADRCRVTVPSVPQDTEVDWTESFPTFRRGDEEFQIADTPRLDFRHLCRRERNEMQLVAQLADANAYAIVGKVGRAHLGQIGDSLPGSAAEERHAPQILCFIT